VHCYAIIEELKVGGGGALELPEGPVYPPSPPPAPEPLLARCRRNHGDDPRDHANRGDALLCLLVFATVGRYLGLWSRGIG
jgi:hypothetical protein